MPISIGGGSSGGGGGASPTNLGDIVGISVDVVPVTQVAPSGYLTFTQLTHDSNQYHEGSAIPSWISIDTDPTKLILAAGTYRSSVLIEAAVGTGNGGLSVMPHRTGSGPATNFVIIPVSGGGNATNLSENEFSIVSGYGRATISYDFSVPSALAHRTVKWNYSFNSMDGDFDGSLVVNEISITKIS